MWRLPRFYVHILRRFVAVINETPITVVVYSMLKKIKLTLNQDVKSHPTHQFSKVLPIGMLIHTLINKWTNTESLIQFSHFTAHIKFLFNKFERFFIKCRVRTHIFFQKEFLYKAKKKIIIMSSSIISYLSERRGGITSFRTSATISPVLITLSRWNKKLFL